MKKTNDHAEPTIFLDLLCNKFHICAFLIYKILENEIAEKQLVGFQTMDVVISWYVFLTLPPLFETKLIGRFLLADSLFFGELIFPQ